MNKYLFFLLGLGLVSCKTTKVQVQHLITNAMIYDGSGNTPYTGCIGWNSDTIAYIGDGQMVQSKTMTDAKGKALSPGFVNMLSWAPESLIHDGRSMSDLKQGVTLEIFGEGTSMGPLNEAMKTEWVASMGEYPYEIKWTTLGGYFDFLEQKGVSCNFGSFLGAATPRVYELGYANKAPDSIQLHKMKELVRQAMEEGAMGIASALIYATGAYAKTEELIEMAKVASSYGGMYISHMRSEGNAIWGALNELFTISKQANIPAEIYHLKISGKDNWPYQSKMEQLIDSAQKAGLKITADMYNYTAGSTGLDAAMPTWCQEGGYAAWAARLKNPALRKKIIAEMETQTNAGWENMYKMAGPENMLAVGFYNKNLRKYVGKTIAQIAKERNKSAAETILDLVIEDSSRVDMVYFLMSEENVKRNMQLPYVSFCSDAQSIPSEGKFLENSTHPRTYGSFARLLGKYVRDEKVIPLQEAIRKLTALPCSNLKIKDRGLLKVGYKADLVLFDPATIMDHATYEKPHQYATGVEHVFVNGVQVIKNGDHTGAMPGKAVRGPGWNGK